MKTLTPFLFLALATASVSALPAFAAKATAAVPSTALSTPSAKPDEMTRGEIKKIDLATGKVTIKHGEIKNLDMPAMTMVFKLTKPAEANNFKVGDNVQFRADNLNGAFVVTEIAAVR